MRTGDPRLEAAKNAAQERIETMDKLTLTVGKAHLAIEQAMDALISAAMPHTQNLHLRRTDSAFLARGIFAKRSASTRIARTFGRSSGP